VGFSGRTDLWWLRALKPGFRHCLVALPDGRGGWLVYEPMAHATRIAALPAGAIGDPLAWFQAHGVLPVPVRLRPVPRRAAPWGPFTCVEAVKRALGIRAVGVLTPWQLFRYVTRAEKKVLDFGRTLGL
jgi:hypothetical protein